jgi:hypothetical protein
MYTENSAGTAPMSTSPRQPTTGSNVAASRLPRSRPAGTNTVTSAPRKLGLDVGTNSWTSGRSTLYRPPTPAPMTKRISPSNNQLPSGTSAIAPGAKENVSTAAINTFLRPILSARWPNP